MPTTEIHTVHDPGLTPMTCSNTHYYPDLTPPAPRAGGQTKEHRPLGHIEQPGEPFDPHRPKRCLPNHPKAALDSPIRMVTLPSWPTKPPPCFTVHRGPIPVRHHMHLHEVIAGLSESPPESMIFAERIGGEFRPDSAAVVLELSESELSRPVREVAAERAPGMEYFLEVSIALEILEGLRSQGADLGGIAERIIYYAEHDA